MEDVTSFAAIGEETLSIELKKLRDTLKEIDIDIILCYGVLLGAIRENRFLPWDKDIDVFLLPHIDLEKVKKHLIDKGYDAVSSGATDVPFGEFLWAKRYVDDKIIVFELQQVHYKDDIAFTNKYLGDSYNKEVKKAATVYPKRMFAELDTIEFYGEKYFIPSNAKEYLTMTYYNWKEPEEYVDWRYHTKSLQEGWVEMDNEKEENK